MRRLRVRRLKGGTYSVTGMAPLVAEVVFELPDLLGADQPDVVKRRLFPDPSDDPEAAAEWRRAQHPELFALIADAKRIVEVDLPSLACSAKVRTWRLRIPAAHMPAWIAALNAARLALGAMHDVVAADMDPAREPTFDERGLAILRIDLYAWLQGVLIDAVAPQG